MEITNKNIPRLFEEYIENYNPSTEIGTSEFKVVYNKTFIWIGRGPTIWHVLKEMVNKFNFDFIVQKYELINNSKIK